MIRLVEDHRACRHFINTVADARQTRVCMAASSCRPLFVVKPSPFNHRQRDRATKSNLHISNRWRRASFSWSADTVRHSPVARPGSGADQASSWRRGGLHRLAKRSRYVLASRELAERVYLRQSIPSVTRVESITRNAKWN